MLTKLKVLETATSMITKSTMEIVMAQFAALGPSASVLLNPGFEEITGSGPGGSMKIRPNTGGSRVYLDRFQAATCGGSTVTHVRA
jgi:hypothetical protein